MRDMQAVTGQSYMTDESFQKVAAMVFGDLSSNSMTAHANTALLRNEGVDAAKGVLARFTAFILHPIQAVMSWVNQLLHGPAPKVAEASDNLALPQGTVLTLEKYEERLPELTAFLHRLELCKDYSGTSIAMDAEDLFNMLYEGLGTRDWLQGSDAAKEIVAREKDETKQVSLANHLNQLIGMGHRLIQRNAEVKTLDSVPTLDGVTDRKLWLGPENSLERMKKLRGALLGIEGGQSLSKRSEATKLLGKKIRGDGVEVWLQRGAPGESGMPGHKWFRYTSLEEKIEVAKQLNGWTDKATKLLCEPETDTTPAGLRKGRPDSLGSGSSLHSLELKEACDVIHQVPTHEELLDPENSLERIGKLGKRLFGIRDDESTLYATSREAGFLLSKRIRLDMAVWIKGKECESVNTWLTNASSPERLEVGEKLNGWMDDAAALLDKAEAEKLKFKDLRPEPSTRWYQYA
jgi:hypothetical protein